MTTIRLLMPQWQGGNNPAYMLGAKLLAWLAPDSNDPLIEVPIDIDGDEPLMNEHGIYARKALLRQLRAARAIIESHAPDRIIVFGGDCLVEQAPFAYLNERYNGKLGVLWIDAHPDVATPKERSLGHTMVLGSLLGQGDEEFMKEVRVPLEPNRVMLAGLGRLVEQETDFIERLGIRHVSSPDLAAGSTAVLNWIQDVGIEHLAIHLDLDVLDPSLFRALGFAKPQTDPVVAAASRKGSMTFDEVVALIVDVSRQANVVALGITEHLPWEAVNLQNMLKQIPILMPNSDGQ